MSEREYVEKILAAVRAYQTAIAECRLNVRSKEHEVWANLKASLSPSTAIELCETWLVANKRDR